MCNMLSKPTKIKRVTILLDSLMVESWMLEAILLIMNSGHSDVVQLVVNSSDGLYKSAISKLFNNLHKFFYYCFATLDTYFQTKFFGATAREIVNLEDFLSPDINIIYAVAKRTKYTDEFDEPTLKKISDADPDVIVRFGFRILAGQILTLARLGIWSYHHGDPDEFRGGPACFWEVMERRPTTGLILQKINDELDGGEILKKRFVATAQFSPAANYNQALWSGVNFLEQALRDYANDSATNVKLLPFDNSIRKAPNNLNFIILFASLVCRIIYRSIQKLVFIDQWIIYFSRTQRNKIKDYSKLIPPKDRFWADPFVIKRDGREFLFFEELITKNVNAHIAVGELLGNQLVDIKPAIVENYHLSYPYLIEIDNQLYMIPESSSNQTIDLYQCEKFPDKWKKVRTLMNDVSAVDSNVMHQDGRWWLFTCIHNYVGECPHSSFQIFWTDDIFAGDWTAHSQNPIISDVRSARSGGSIIQDSQNLYRVSQDCSLRYGYSLSINKIDVLTIEQYEETLAETFGPHWNDKTWATHTFNKCGDFSVIDALQTRWRYFKK